MTAILVAQGIAILLLAILVVGLLRSHADILRSLHKLGVGEDFEHRHEGAVSQAAPTSRLNDDPPADVSGQTLRGSAIHVGVSGTPSQTLLAFLSTGCSACIGLWEDLARDPTGGIGGARLVLVVKGPAEESPARLEQLAPGGVTLVQSSDAWVDYGVPVTPYFVLVDGATGTVVGEGSANSWGQVRSLMEQAGADLAAKASAKVANTEGELELRADAELRKAGIGPGHPSLYPERSPIDGVEQ